MDEREGVYETWKWDAMRECWSYDIPCRVYPHGDGKFTASHGEVWADGIFSDFESAERAALGCNTE